MESNAQAEQNQTGPDTTGFIIAPMAAAAALDSAAFSKVNAFEAVPAIWEERIRKALEYYVEEPMVKNCVNPVSVKVKYAQGEFTEARQFPEEKGAGEPIPLPVDQVIHLKWEAPAFSLRGNSLMLPAFQSIELLRDYRRSEQAIAKRRATPFRLLKVAALSAGRW